MAASSGSNMFEEAMRTALERRRATGTLRELRTAEADSCFVDFGSNDYLGLARSGELLEASLAEAERARKEASTTRRRRRPASLGGHGWGKPAPPIHQAPPDAEAGPGQACPVLGSGGSRLLSGNTGYVERLELWIAAFHNRDAALIFNSGYDANLGILSCLPQPLDTVLHDELLHNSMQMGLRLGRQRKTVPFRHNDMIHLEQLLRTAAGSVAVAEAEVEATVAAAEPPSAAGRAKTHPGQRPKTFVAVESVYSMDGDLAPLEEVLRLARLYGAGVIVDEAHGTGVFGLQGRGLVNELGLEAHPSLLATVHTFGKALGVHGAAVVGGSTLREFLVNYARPFIYSTSLPLHSLACIKCAYVMQAGEDGRRRKLWTLADTFQRALVEPCQTGDGAPPPLPGQASPAVHSPIQSVGVAGNDSSSRVAQGLRHRGFDVRAIRSPTVPKGTERLRVTLHAHNSEGEVRALAYSIRALVAAEAARGTQEDRVNTMNADSDTWRESHVGPPAIFPGALPRGGGGRPAPTWLARARL